MPDTTLAESYLATAEKLISVKNPSSADIRKSISCSYFAVFHALARACAFSLAGEIQENRSNKAWVEIYRGLSHGVCQDACKKAKNIDFPDELKNFANNFVQLQDARKRADYDPICRPTYEIAIFCRVIAEKCLNSLKEAPEYDKVAFSTWVLITTPGARQAREIHKNGSQRGLESVFSASESEQE